MHVSLDLSTARRRLMADRLSLGQAMVASALAREFKVSEDTIRRDLRLLAREGLCTRVYGGAMPLSPASTPMQVRAGEDAARKRALALAATELIQPGQTLFLDTGSTVLQLAGVLPRGLRLTVVTHSLPAAAALMTRDDLALMVIGGPLDRATGGCFGARAMAELSRVRVDLGFLGACALSARDGLAGFDAADVELKAALIEQSGATALMMTNPKLETAAPFRIAPASAVRHLVLEHDASEGVASLLAQAGCNVRRAARPGP